MPTRQHKSPDAAPSAIVIPNAVAGSVWCQCCQRSGGRPCHCRPCHCRPCRCRVAARSLLPGKGRFSRKLTPVSGLMHARYCRIVTDDVGPAAGELDRLYQDPRSHAKDRSTAARQELDRVAGWIMKRWFRPEVGSESARALPPGRGAGDGAAAQFRHVLHAGRRHRAAAGSRPGGAQEGASDNA